MNKKIISILTASIISATTATTISLNNQNPEYNEYCVQMVNEYTGGNKQGNDDYRRCVRQLLKPLNDGNYIIENPSIGVGSKVVIKDIIKWHKQVVGKIGINKKILSADIIESKSQQFVDEEFIKKYDQIKIAN